MYTYIIIKYIYWSADILFIFTSFKRGILNDSHLNVNDVIVIIIQYYNLYVCHVPGSFSEYVVQIFPCSAVALTDDETFRIFDVTSCSNIWLCSTSIPPMF